MNSEYKISRINRNEESDKIICLVRFYEIVITTIQVTEANCEQFIENSIGDSVQNPVRTKIVGDYEYTFNISTTEEQIHSYLRNEAMSYGSPIN